MTATTMYRINRGEYQAFASTLSIAQEIRTFYPELKGGRITNVLQMLPQNIQLARLYKGDELVPQTKLTLSMPQAGAEKLARIFQEGGAEADELRGMGVLDIKVRK